MNQHTVMAASPHSPIELPKLSGNQFCPYTEPKSGRQHIWSWIGRCFPDADHPAARFFVKTLAAIMNDACDPKDKNRMCLSDVPSPAGKQTFSPYGGDELAAWWNEAVALVPKELLESDRPPPTPSSIDASDAAAIPDVPAVTSPADSPAETAEDIFDFKPRPGRRRTRSFECF
jgi:hypothetical protein